MNRYYHAYYPDKPGWTRRWHRLQEAAKVVGMALAIVAFMFLLPWIGNVMAPAGAVR